jgi:hypothetical protein
MNAATCSHCCISLLGCPWISSRGYIFFFASCFILCSRLSWPSSLSDLFAALLSLRIPHLLPLPFRDSLLSYTVRSTIIHGFLSAGFALLDKLLMRRWLSRRPWLLRQCGIERYLGDRLFNESENWPSRRGGRGLLYYCRITFDVSEEKGVGGWFAVPGCALCRLLLNAPKHIRIKRLLLRSSAFLTRSLLFR